MKNLNQVERIKIKLSLAKSTDSYLEQFGSSSHKYLLNPPISIEKVENFENKMNISIPNELKLFYTEIGYGGVGYDKESHHNLSAGPDYGIMTLDNPLLFFIETDSGALQKEPYFNREITHDIWYKRFCEDVEDESDEAFEKDFELAFSGMMNISSCGCQGYSSIILNGNDTGRVLQSFSELEYSPSFYKEFNFLDWYENWLDGIISGTSFIIYRNYSVSEDDMISRFVGNTDYHWKIVSLSYIRTLPSLSKQSLKILIEKMNSEPDLRVKNYILNLLTQFDYTNTKPYLSLLLKEDPMAFLRNIHLFAPEKTSEWKAEIINLAKEKLYDESLQLYIKYISLVDMEKSKKQ